MNKLFFGYLVGAVDFVFRAAGAYIAWFLLYALATTNTKNEFYEDQALLMMSFSLTFYYIITLGSVLLDGKKLLRIVDYPFVFIAFVFSLISSFTYGFNHLKEHNVNEYLFYIIISVAIPALLISMSAILFKSEKDKGQELFDSSMLKRNIKDIINSLASLSMLFSLIFYLFMLAMKNSLPH